MREGQAYAAVRKMVTDNPRMTLTGIGASLAKRGLTVTGRNGKTRPFTSAQVNRFIIAMQLDRVDARTRGVKGS